MSCKSLVMNLLATLVEAAIKGPRDKHCDSSQCEASAIDVDRYMP